MVVFQEGLWIWLPHPRDGFVPAQLIDHTATTVTAKSQQDEHFVLPAAALSQLVEAHSSSLSIDIAETNNLTDCEELSEGAILHSLRQRYENDAIYTNISNILLSINPYKQLPLYGPHSMRAFHAALTQRQKTDPHIYALAHRSYAELTETNRPQSIVIAGESGAGKTEATKLCLQYLAEVSGTGEAVEQQILQANPIIEAFGNAKTVRNNNSSRFGKFISVRFNDRLKINGAEISAYLLEKSRVCTQNVGETNFHIFYALCQEATDEEKKRYNLLPVNEYRILNPQSQTKDGENQSVEPVVIKCEIPMSEVREAFAVLNFNAEHQSALFRALSAILRIGNLQFVESKSGKGFQTSESDLAIISELLCIDAEKLKLCLLTRRLLIGGEVITQVHSKEQCIEVQQSLCKSFYSSLFAFLIDHINQTLKTKTPSKGDDERWIGVLDIFGFENFPINQWEQLCINFANEKLQQQFINICLSMEQAEYRAEGLPIANVDFVDNQACLDLIEAKRVGLIDMINEEIRLPKGSDANLLQRMHTAFASPQPKSSQSTNQSTSQPPTMASQYIKPKTSSQTQFGIRHYAGDVVYEIAGMLDKNKGDMLSEDVYEALDSSSDDFMRELLYWGKRELSINQSTNQSTAQKQQISHSRGTSRNAIPTQGAQFRTQLIDLLTTLNLTNTHFIKCLKPNSEKIADYFDGQFVKRQLNYLGVREVIQVRKSGFPVRIKRSEFIRRYRLLFDLQSPNQSINQSSDDDGRALVAKLFGSLSADPSSWFNGHTKVLLKSINQSILEEQRQSTMARLIVRLQTRYRCRLLVRRYAAVKQCARELEAALTEESISQSINQLNNQALNQSLELDTLISRATDLDLPQPIITKAKLTRHRIWLANQSINELIASVKSRDRSIIEAAVNRAISQSINESVPSLVEAKAWLARNDVYIQSINQSMKERDLDRLVECLIYAKEMALDTELESKAYQLQRVLQAEKSINQSINQLLENDCQNISEFESLLAEVEKMKIDRSINQSINQSVEKARARINQLQCEQEDRSKLISQAINQLRSSLSNARDSLDVNVIQNSLNEVIQSINQSIDKTIETTIKNDEAYIKCVSLLQSINQFESECDIAIKSQDIDRLIDLLNQSKNNRWDTLPCVSLINQSINRIERDAELRTMLKTAIESRQSNVLTAAIEKAEKRALQRQSETQSINQSDIDQLNTARTILAELQSEAQLQEQDAAASMPTAEKEKRHSLILSESINQSINQSLQQSKHLDEQVTRENDQSASPLKINQSINQSFNPQPFLSPSLALHLCPILRSPDDFVKGKWLGKTQMKKTMLSFTKDAIVRSLTNLDGLYSTSINQSTNQSTNQSVNHSNEASRQQSRRSSIVSNSQSVHQSVNSSTGEDLNLVAISVFKSVQGWMGDRSYSFTDTLAYDLLSIGCCEPALRDEIYIQTIKQLRDNPKVESCVKGWQLMGLLSETFQPTDVFKPYVYHFLLTSLHTCNNQPVMPSNNPCNNQSINQSICNYIEYCLHIFHHRRPTLIAPTLTHISSFRNRLMNTSILPVRFSDDSLIDCEVSPDISAGTVIMRICHWLGHVHIGEQEENDENWHGLSIYQHGPGQREICLANEECLLDYPAAQCTDGSMFLILKKRFFSQINQSTTNNQSINQSISQSNEFTSLHPLIQSLVYHQCVRDACAGVYDLQRQELIEILAIHRRYRVNHEYPTIGRINNQSINQSIYDLQPLVFSYWDSNAIHAFEREVQSSFDHQQLIPVSQRPGVTRVIELIQRRKEFAACLFDVNQEDRAELPRCLLIAVNTFGICLINESSKQLISAFKFAHITGWASNSMRFCLRVLVSKGKTVQLNFKTEKGKIIVRTIQQNVDWILKQQQKQAALKLINQSINHSHDKHSEECKESISENGVQGTGLKTETIIQVG